MHKGIYFKLILQQNKLYKEACPKYRRIYQLLLLMETVNVCTQKSRGILFSVIICFFLIILLDRKNAKGYIGVFIVMAAGLTYNILQRWELSEIVGDVETKGLKRAILMNKGIFGKLAEQTKSRRPVWSVAFNIMDDFPWFGVGPGHFKYYLQIYAPEIQRPYIDAHNIFLNFTTELGIPFALVFFVSWWTTVIKTFKNAYKSKKPYFKEFIYPGFIGMLCLLVYGSITGQAFMTSRAPISIVPAFVFTIIITIYIILGKKYTGDKK
jgi:O-antigen ligase